MIGILTGTFWPTNAAKLPMPPEKRPASNRAFTRAAPNPPQRRKAQLDAKKGLTIKSNLSCPAPPSNICLGKPAYPKRLNDKA